MVRRHLSANLEFYGTELGLILFRKHVSKYIHSIAGARELRTRLLTAETVEAFEQLVSEAESRIARAA